MQKNAISVQSALHNKQPSYARLSRSGEREAGHVDDVTFDAEKEWSALVLEFINYARSKFPQEACAVIVSGALFICENIHPDPVEHFKIGPADIYKASQLGALQGVLHSHTRDNAGPSAADMRNQRYSGMPWGIVVFSADGVYRGTNWFGDTLPIAPLVGRLYVHGVHDCFSVVRHYYAVVHGVFLNDHPRDHEWWVSPSNPNHYEKSLIAEGFVRIPPDDLLPGDGVLMSIYPGGYHGERCANHSGVYLGDGMMLHHLYSGGGRATPRLSKTERLLTWRDFIVTGVRHTKVNGA